MGVSGFYRWLVQRYPLVRHRLNDLAHPKINHFYIDFNCIIYNSIRLIKPVENGDNTFLFNEVCRYLDLLVQTIKPESTLFIAVDGPAPLAKCSQQRTRRFLASRDHVEGTFSTANISVGTPFMEKLHEHLKNFFAQRVKEDKTWSKPRIIYSSHRTPGEGEHKFFTYIREQKKSGQLNENETHCVYSPDADLIFLSLQTGIKNMYIMREWTQWMGPFEGVGNGELDKMRVSQNDFELLHLPILIDYFKKQYHCEGEEGEKNIQRIINDFIAISFLVGNDFIPHFPEINIASGDFDYVLSTYQLAISDKHKFLIEENITFNQESLYLFLQALIKKVGEEHEKKKKGGKDQGLRLHTIDGARSYLKSKYKGQYDEHGVFEEQLCHAVLDSFNWVLKYYLEGVPSWTWSFNYHYAPPLVLVAEYTKGYESKFELDRPPYPLEQLLCILPPKMCKILPGAFGSLMFKPSPLAKFYPEKFNVDLNGRKYEHEGCVLIPFINVQEVRAETSKQISLLSDEEKKRNEWMENIIINDVKPAPLVGEQPGIPHLTGFNYKMDLRSLRLEIFTGRPASFGMSYCVTPEFDTTQTKKLDDYAPLISKLVLFDWPFSRPAIVQGVFDEKDCITKNKEGKYEKSPAGKNHDEMAKILRIKRGIDVNDSKIGVIVTPYVISSIDGSITRSNIRRFFPLELIQQDTVKVMRRYFIPKAPLPKIDDLVVLKGEKYGGRKAIIKEINEKTMKVQLIEEKFIDVSFLSGEKYEYTLPQLAEQVDLPADVLKCVLSSVPVSGYTEVRSADVALTVMFDKLVLDGYVTRRNNEVFFSKEIITMIKDYLDKTELHSVFFKSKPNDKGKLTVTNKQIGKIEAYNKIVEYIKRQSKVSSAFLVPSTQKMVTHNATLKLCIRLNNSPYSSTLGEVIEVPVENVHYKGMTGNRARCEPGKRVRSIAPNGPVPFGTLGTVVGFNVETFEVFVVTDEVFTLGSNLRMRLNSPRGYVANSNDVIVLEQ